VTSSLARDDPDLPKLCGDLDGHGSSCRIFERYSRPSTAHAEIFRVGCVDILVISQIPQLPGLVNCTERALMSPSATTYRDRRLPDWPAFTASSTACPHLLMPRAQAVNLRCRPVCETPIYHQLRSEGITADVTSSETAQPRDDEGRCGRVPVRSAESSADHVAHQHPVPTTADQPGGALQPTAAVWRLPAILARPEHARQTRMTGPDQPANELPRQTTVTWSAWRWPSPMRGHRRGE
jgi:hypothetical protein